MMIELVLSTLSGVFTINVTFTPPPQSFKEFQDKESNGTNVIDIVGQFIDSILPLFLFPKIKPL